MLLIFCTSVYGADAKPSEESIKEMLRVTESQKLLDNVMTQMDGIMKTAMQQAFKGKPITLKEQKIIDGVLNKMIVIYRQDMNWEILEPLFIRVYRDSFTQEEVDGMLVFYKSPAGQAVIKKMPLVIQNTTAEMQKRTGAVLQKVLKMVEESVAEMKAEEAKGQ